MCTVMKPLKQRRPSKSQGWLFQEPASTLNTRVIFRLFAQVAHFATWHVTQFLLPLSSGHTLHWAASLAFGQATLGLYLEWILLLWCLSPWLWAHACMWLPRHPSRYVGRRRHRPFHKHIFNWSPKITINGLNPLHSYPGRKFWFHTTPRLLLTHDIVP